jgi:hypothetical protein
MAGPLEVVNSEGRRPRDLALLLLAAPDEPPRARARDQQADRAGGALRRCILDRIAALDPEPEAFEAALASIIQEFGEPTGPTRSLCALILGEWTACQAAPDAWAWLLAEAVAGTDREPRQGKGRRGPAPA